MAELPAGMEDSLKLAHGDQMLADLRAPVKVVAAFYQMCRTEGIPKDVSAELTVRFASNTVPQVFCEADKVIIQTETDEEGDDEE